MLELSAIGAVATEGGAGAGAAAVRGVARELLKGTMPGVVGGVLNVSVSPGDAGGNITQDSERVD